MFSDNYLRVLLIIGFTGIGLLTLKNPVGVLLAPWLPPDVTNFLISLHVGRYIEASATPLWSSIRLGLEVIVGLLLLVAAGLLAAKRNRLAAVVGYSAILLSLTTVNILLFYFEQFSTIITTMIQILVLIGIMIYRRHKG